MKRFDTENLVVFYVPLDDSGENFEKLCINTTLLTKIRYVPGRRSCSEYTIRRRLRNIWRSKHPILKKFYTPCSLWESDIGDWDMWRAPRIVIEYLDEEILTVRFKCNKHAQQARDLMIRKFWE